MSYPVFQNTLSSGDYAALPSPFDLPVRQWEGREYPHVNFQTKVAILAREEFRTCRFDRADPDAKFFPRASVYVDYTNGTRTEAIDSLHASAREFKASGDIKPGDQYRVYGHYGEYFAEAMGFYLDRPDESVTADQYWESYECLPPMDWDTPHGVNMITNLCQSFLLTFCAWKISEATSHDIHDHYAELTIANPGHPDGKETFYVRCNARARYRFDDGTAHRYPEELTPARVLLANHRDPNNPLAAPNPERFKPACHRTIQNRIDEINRGAKA